MTARLRAAALADIPAVVAIESATFPCPWSEGTFCLEIENGVSRFKVLVLGDEVIGYYDLWICADEAHLLNVAVAAANRRQGHGRMMAEDAMREAVRAKCVKMVLEVRTSNVAAISLYEKFGFKKVAQRPRYYADGENADVMMKEL
jgi:ribosomal-protein-alanine N-acetyltransferase